MLRKIRIAAAAVFFTGITLLLLDFSGTLHAWLGWMAKVQFVPALLAVNLGVVAALIVLTLLFGRVYCSVVCPLGILQDVVSWGAGKRKKNRFVYSPALNWLRYGMLVLFVVALVAGIGSLAALLEPYGAFGRIATNLFGPLWQWGNNLLAHFAERMDSYAFYSVDVWVRSGVTLAVAAATLVVLFVLAWRNGRTYCNTVCPVGTILGFFSRFSLFKPRIDTAKCNGCKLCARRCKASCIDPAAHRIDYSRCVACMDCLGNCHQRAISFTRRPARKSVEAACHDQTVDAAEVSSDSKQPADASRRQFLAVAGLFAYGVARAQTQKVDGGLALIEEKKVPERTTPIVPAGAQGMRHMYQHCTGCQLCVAACPNHVLRPSNKLITLMQPEMSYERGYCRPECTKCSEVCPAGAIRPITTADKSSTQIGHAVWIRENCVTQTDGVSCNNCYRHCPAGAISLVADVAATTSRAPKIPVVDEMRCIGCGACEHLCPARPFSAIYVEGNQKHRMI